jgi:hypothetical protein
VCWGLGCPTRQSSICTKIDNFLRGDNVQLFGPHFQHGGVGPSNEPAVLEGTEPREIRKDGNK